MRWKLDQYDYAGHEISIVYRPISSKLIAEIQGPRAGSTSKERYANDIEWKIKSRIPFTSPTAKIVNSQAYEIYRAAREEIDNAIAAHHKKQDDEYK